MWNYKNYQLRYKIVINLKLTGVLDASGAAI